MRLIDADALMDALGIAVECKDCSRNGTFGCKEDSAFVYACESITDAPTIDAVEVVRCKDCVSVRYCRFAQGLGLDGYCSMGERREEC